jgi:signal transduction histidine kinase
VDPPVSSPDLLGLVAHDLRSPLAGIAGLAEHLLDGHGDELPADARADLGLLAEEAQRLTAFANDLLELARAGGEPLEREPVELGDVVQDVLGRLRAAIEDRGAEVTLRRSCTCFAHRSAVSQVIQNLVENAVRHGGDGSHVEIRCTALDGYVRIDVMDDGPGIPEEAREAAVRPFTQLAGEAPGSGLGLTIAHMLATRHGGTLAIGDSPLGGARVSVTLPQRC